MEEEKLINLLIEGKNKNEIADIFNVSRDVVKWEVKKLYKKYNVYNKIQLAITYKLKCKVN